MKLTIRDCAPIVLRHILPSSTELAAMRKELADDIRRHRRETGIRGNFIKRAGTTTLSSGVS